MFTILSAVQLAIAGVLTVVALILMRRSRVTALCALACACRAVAGYYRDEA